MRTLRWAQATVGLSVVLTVAVACATGPAAPGPTGSRTPTLTSSRAATTPPPACAPPSNLGPQSYDSSQLRSMEEAPPSCGPLSDPIPPGSALLTRDEIEAKASRFAENITRVVATLMTGSQAQALQLRGELGQVDESRPVWVVTVYGLSYVPGDPEQGPRPSDVTTIVFDALTGRPTDQCWCAPPATASPRPS